MCFGFVGLNEVLSAVLTGGYGSLGMVLGSGSGNGNPPRAFKPIPAAPNNPPGFIGGIGLNIEYCESCSHCL